MLRNEERGGQDSSDLLRRLVLFFSIRIITVLTGEDNFGAYIMENSDSQTYTKVFIESDKLEFANRPADAVLRASGRSATETLAFLQHAEEPPSSHASTIGG
jgi:hypothetical protein